MPRTCTICAHPERNIIDAMIASKESFLQIATRFNLNNKTVTTHGHNCVEPFLNSIELQAQAAVLQRVMAYRDAVNLPLPEKSKYVENELWADFELADKVQDRVAIAKAIAMQQQEQAKLAGAYIKDAPNPKGIDQIVAAFTDRLKAKGYPVEEIPAAVAEYRASLEGVKDETGGGVS